MDDYAREMMDLKTLVTRTLEKKGVLAKIRAELRASIFEAIEEEDRVIENEDSGLPPALLGSCNDRAKQLHTSPSGRLLTALVCEYLEWAQLGHTLKVYLPECNLEKDFWKAELREFTSKNDYDMHRNSENKPMLLDILEGFFEIRESVANKAWKKIGFIGDGLCVERRGKEHSQVFFLVDSRCLAAIGEDWSNFPAFRRLGLSVPNFRKDEYSWRYDNDLTEDVLRASNALENIHLDRKSRNLSTSWRRAGDGVGEDDDKVDRS
ncbi:hypothetical protein HPP92_019287 [Vanilla planifolia]|uniref:LisH domain-containing protein n=1 Tax=Vanilla planifolia TaxID=51239 RepID=A0A835QA04_VANPL|nr:hypothetical protein HPP92_019287 [Vanilla planifolia]